MSAPFKLPKTVTLADLARKAASGHSVYSPSGSKMWLTCLGSLIPNLLAEDEGSAEAAEGTVAHGIGEEWLATGKRPKGLVGLIEVVGEHEIEITDEMMAYVGDYVEYVESLREDSVEFLVETRVDFSDLTPIPDQGGTADSIVLIHLGGGEYELVVTDLKYGKGVRVIAEGNTQGMIYAYGAWRIFAERYNIVRVRIRICHPRLTGGTTEFVVSIPDLLDFAAYVKQRAFAAWDMEAPRTPSEDGCRWCKVQARCAARKAWLAEITSGVFDEDDDEERTYTVEDQKVIAQEAEDDLAPPSFRFADPALLSVKAMARILRYRKGAEQFFASIERELLARKQKTEEDIPGWKLVQGRSIRRWPEQEVPVYLKLKALGLTDTAIYEESIITPAAAERKLHAKAGLSTEEAAKVVNSLAIKPQGSLSLVRETDNRKAALTSGDVFDDDD